MMYSDLFDSILIRPASEGADELRIVSGYASAAMAFHHLEALRDRNLTIGVALLVGMCIEDGLARSNHRGFQVLESRTTRSPFTCSYVFKRPAVHSKVYTWLKSGVPVQAFVGSANYTQTAFGNGRREAMTTCDPNLAYTYFQDVSRDGIYCSHQDAESLVQVYSDNQFVDRSVNRDEPEEGERLQSIPGLQHLPELPRVTVSLLDRSGELPTRSGLNWGQRPNEGREPNQAYIRLPSDVYNTGFFPDRGIHFTVLTDDDKVLICTRAQDNGKAIHTPHNNSLIGEYFRGRLGLSSGALVDRSHLEHYGRTSVDFYKIDDETYFLDFGT